MTLANDITTTVGAREAILADLDRILDGARWAHGYAYGKAGRGLSAEHGSDLSKSVEEKEAEAARYDVGVGSHPAREAYHQAADTLNAAQGALQQSITLIQRRVARPVPLGAYSTPDDLAAGARAIRRLLGFDQPAKTLTHVRTQFDSTVRALSKALDVGRADGIAHGEMCVTCTIRPKLEGKKRECETCDRYRRRTGVKRDAAKLDHEPILLARQAQQRRIARGEHWGMG